MRRPCALRVAVTLGAALTVLVPGIASASAGPAPGSPAYLARDPQNIADAYGRQTAPDGQLTPAYGLANAEVIGPVYAQQLLAQAGDGGAGLEQRQPLPRRLGRQPRADHPGHLHEPLRRADPRRRLHPAAGSARPVQRPGAVRP